MVLRMMKNFDIFGVHWKIPLLGKVHEKPIYSGDCLTRGPGQFADLREVSLARMRGWYFWEGGWYLNAHYDNLESVC